MARGQLPETTNRLAQRQRDAKDSRRECKRHATKHSVARLNEKASQLASGLDPWLQVECRFIEYLYDWTIRRRPNPRSKQRAERPFGPSAPERRKVPRSTTGVASNANRCGAFRADCDGQWLVRVGKKWPAPRQLLSDLLYSRLLSPFCGSENSAPGGHRKAGV
jgi:hypothetical protein